MLMGEVQAVPPDTQVDRQVDTRSVRQAARRAAPDAQDKVKKRRPERDKRLSELGIEVAIASSERDAAVARPKRRARAALRAMTDDQGLEPAHAVQ